MSIDREYLYFENPDKLGQLRMHFGTVEKEGIVIRPALKPLEKREGDIYTAILKPGYIDVKDKFHECPVSIFYFQLYLIKQIEDYRGSFPYETTIKIYFRLFDKDFSKSKEFEVIFSKKDSSCLRHDSCEELANRLNLFVYNGGDINEIKLSGRNHKDFYLKNHRIIIQIINNLEIEIFENSRGSMKPGGDDCFWDEAEIRNLPDDHYLVNLIEKELSNNNQEVKRTDFGFLITFNHEQAYSPAYPRRKADNNKEIQLIDEIKECLKVDMASVYNNVNHFEYNIIR